MTETALNYQINAKDITTSKERIGVDCIGAGAFGDVRRVYTQKYGVSAAKIFKTTGTNEQYRTTINKIKEEADVLAFASHENVVRFQAVSNWSSFVAIIMQYEERGSLHQLLQADTVTTLPFNLRYRMAYEISKAMVFLHNFGVDDRMVHGDLKTSNILLNEDLRIRVADFGAANIGTITCGGPTNTDRPSNTLVYTVAFSAPELLKDIFQRRSTSMDVFSYGRVLYEIITRKIPYQGREYSRLSSDIIDGAEPDFGMIPVIEQPLQANIDDLNLFKSMDSFMRQCSRRNPTDRPSMLTVEKEMRDLKNKLSAVTLLKSVALVLNQMQPPVPESSETSRVTLNKFIS